MKKTEKVFYEVTCHNDPAHVIEKCFEIELGTENIPTGGEVFCSKCNDFVAFKIHGKVIPRADILRILQKHNLRKQT